MPAVIDTNVLIYDTFEDTRFHRAARELLESLDGWYVPSTVLREYIWFFKSRGYSLSQARTMITEYMKDPRFRGLEDNPRVILRTIDILESNGLPLAKFNDVVVLYYASRYDVPLATFDERFRELAVKLGIDVLPERLYPLPHPHPDSQSEV
ncbi:MAG: PIN domain-containing protein [Thermococci archaeon]|nr:PIN domain-containing protein [Thermococci archaeon]